MKAFALPLCQNPQTVVHAVVAAVVVDLVGAIFVVAAFVAWTAVVVIVPFLVAALFGAVAAGGATFPAPATPGVVIVV